MSAFYVGIGFAYFAGCFIVTSLLMVPVARHTFLVNQGEGFYRFRHARLKEFAESSACACPNAQPFVDVCTTTL